MKKPVVSAERNQLVNRLLFLVDPAPDAVEIAANLILMLLTNPPPPYPVITTRTNEETSQIEIIAEYPRITPSAPLLHPQNGAQTPKATVCTSRIKKRRCTVSARPRTRH